MKKPKRIILIRHGESEGNVDRGTYGYKPDYALELSLRGFAQAMEAGVNLKNIVQFVSLIVFGGIFHISWNLTQSIII